MSVLAGAPCVVCNAGVMTAKVRDARGNYVGQTYYVCSNRNVHNDHKATGDPLKSPWILESDTEKVQAYLDRAAGNPPAKKAKSTASAAPLSKPTAAAAAINNDHVLVAISAKVANMQSRLEHLISLFEAKNSTAESTDEPDADE